MHQQGSKDRTHRFLQIIATNTAGTYLGCPNIDEKRTRVYFEEIKHIMGQKLVG